MTDANTGGWGNIPKVSETSDDDFVDKKDIAPEDVGMDEVDTNPPEPTPEQMQAQFEKDAEELQKHTCPKCQWDIRNKYLKAREEDLQEYTRCIVASREFSKDIPMFHGKLVCRFVENGDVVRDNINALLRTLEVDNMTQLELVTATRKIQVLYSLKKLKAGEEENVITLPQEENKEFENAKEAIAEFDKRFGGKSASVQGIIMRAYIEFDRLLMVLADGAFDQNFYQGAGLV